MSLLSAGSCGRCAEESKCHHILTGVELSLSRAAIQFIDFLLGGALPSDVLATAGRVLHFLVPVAKYREDRKVLGRGRSEHPCK